MTVLVTGSFYMPRKVGTMERFYILAWVAILLLACSLTENGVTMSAAILPKATESPTAAQVVQNIPTPRPTPSRCTVDTGAAQGRLNLRACGSTSCGVIFVLDEGDRLTILAAGDWLNVQTETGAAGYINSSYCRGAK